jgi:hypothetical protein
MPARGTRGAYRKEDRVQLPPDLQKELVERAAARYGNCQELAKHLNIPKSSVHYYRVGRLTMPVSVLDEMLRIANDEDLKSRVESNGIEKDRSWATEHAQDVFREMCREKVRLPTREELEQNDDLRRKAAAIVSYVLAEGSVWLQKEKFGEHAANITFADHEEDLYDHFRRLCIDVFGYDIGPHQLPGNGTRAIRGFIYSRFVAEWFVFNGVYPGEKSPTELHLPKWVMGSSDIGTWQAALQPWCDGEGHVAVPSRGGRPSFSLVQSRHTDIDFDALGYSPNASRRTVPRGMLQKSEIYGIPLQLYLSTLCRSDVFDDVLELLTRIGLRPKISIASLSLKNDGYWSCFWMIRLRPPDTERLVHMGIITQHRKKLAVISGSHY